jgi:hypothetical protein
MEEEIVRSGRSIDSRLGIKVLIEGISPNIEYVLLTSSMVSSENDCFSTVAIHGLDGHRESSWTAANGILWLRDLLPTQLPHARIVTYDYDAYTSSQSSQVNETLYGHAENFVSRLAMLRNRTTTSVSLHYLTLNLPELYLGSPHHFCCTQLRRSYPQICKFLKMSLNSENLSIHGIMHL